MEENNSSLGNNHIKSFLEYESISADELISTDFPPQKWIVERLIPVGGLSVIFGEGGVYKTRLTINLLISAMKENQWLNKFSTTKAQVLYINEENKPSLVKDILKQLGYEKGLPIRVRSLQNFNITEEHLEVVLAECIKYDINVVLFDPLVHMLNGVNENDAEGMATLAKKFQILTSNSVSVIVLHHSRKPSMNGYGSGHHAMRGSSAIFDAADCVVGITLKNNTITFSHHKSRGDLPLSPFTINVETSEDRKTLRFVYGGAITTKTKKEENVEKLNNRIVEILSGEKPYSQAELLAILKTEGHKINEHSLRNDILPNLLTSERIRRLDGPKNTKFYLAAKVTSPFLQLSTNLTTGKQIVKEVAMF